MFILVNGVYIKCGKEVIYKLVFLSEIVYDILNFVELYGYSVFYFIEEFVMNNIVFKDECVMWVLNEILYLE